MDLLANTPSHVKRDGVFLLQMMRSRRGFIPIRIKRQDKNNVHQQALDTIMFIAE